MEQNDQELTTALGGVESQRMALEIVLAQQDDGEGAKKDGLQNKVTCFKYLEQVMKEIAKARGIQKNPSQDASSHSQEDVPAAVSFEL